VDWSPEEAVETSTSAARIVAKPTRLESMITPSTELNRVEGFDAALDFQSELEDVSASFATGDLPCAERLTVPLST